MKSVQAYINAHAAVRIHQQVSQDIAVKAEKAQCGECNYADNYYGDQVCIGEK